LFTLGRLEGKSGLSVRNSIQGDDEGPKMTRPKVYASVWDALADTP
jgi:hypothetical protein